MSFFTELRQRNVFRVGAAYAVFAWLLIQVADTTFPLFGFDSNPARLVVIILSIGFVPTLILAWVFELTPSGIRRGKDVDRGAAVAPKKLDRIVIVVLVIAVGFFAFDKFVLSESREREIAESARMQALNEAVSAYRSNKSIAVLPFIDMSPQKDQQYFGDGIAEQLLDELTRLKGLNVAARTSSFKFRDGQEDMKSIGEQLGVTYLLEGSVRKDDENVRITAQLIDSQSGFHLWSDTFDRNLDDVFSIQDEIAQTVATKLSISLDVDERDHLPGAGTESIEAFDVFLEGLAYSRRRQHVQAERQFELAIDIDPEYAEAWAALGGAIGVQAMDKLGAEAVTAIELGREHALKAIELNPDGFAGYDMLARFDRVQGNWVGTLEAGQTAARLAPGNIGRQFELTSMFGRLGFVRENIQAFELRREIEPLGYYGHQGIAERYIQAGRYEDAEAALAVSASMSSPHNPSVIKRHLFIALSQGDAAAVKNRLAEFADADPAVAPIMRPVIAGFDAPAEQVLAVLRSEYGRVVNMTGEARVVTAGLAAYLGDAEFALEVMTEELRETKQRLSRLWYPFFSEMRQLLGFKKLAEELNMVSFWRAQSWPDFCRPLKGDEFECF